MPKEGEVRLTPSQADKVWQRAFAASYHEIFEGHPTRAALERFIRAGYGGDEAARWLATGIVDVTIGREEGRRIQQAVEGTLQGGPGPDPAQLDRMAQIAFTQGPVAGSV